MCSTLACDNHEFFIKERCPLCELERREEARLNGIAAHSSKIIIQPGVKCKQQTKLIRTKALGPTILDHGNYADNDVCLVSIKYFRNVIKNDT